MSEKGVVQEAAPVVGVAGRRSLILAACMMATFMAAVESTIVATAMPTIVADLGDFHLFSWIFAAYLLSQAVSIPIYGRLADLFGRKRIFFAGASLFLVGSTLCGFAQGMLSLIVFRALQGMGAGAVQPVAYTIVGDIYTPTERARVQGFLSSVFGISAIVGPSLGAFLVEHVSWSAVFWVNLPIGALAMTMLAVFFREQLHARAPRIDFLASFLLMLGAGTLMMALIQGSSLSPWLLAACIVVGVAALAVLVRHERHVEAPMLPIRFWTNRVIALGNFGSFAIGMVMMSVSAFLPTYVQGVMGRSAAVTGMVLAAMSISWAVASAGSGRVMIRTSYRVSAMFGGTMLVLGSIVLMTMVPESGPLWAGAGALLIGLGMGSCNTTYLVSVQAVATQRERGAATASNMFMRIVGQSTGAALFGALVNIGLLHFAPRAGEVAARLMQPALRQHLAPAEIATLTSAMAAAVRNVYVVGAVVGLVVLVLGARLPAALGPTTTLDRGRP
ncbi:MDR family MFS transporter [Reyranella sp.]|jgi:EmrB/QacA subfamily drug resistance transporter|uniref:MDR family MFS transporter n=1 Tax=Reyranella sp. TaxID=1929291 RepID=UPI002F92E0EA